MTMGCFCCKSHPQGVHDSPRRRSGRRKNRSSRHSRLEEECANLEALSSAYTGGDQTNANARGWDHANADAPSLLHRHAGQLEDDSLHAQTHGMGRSLGAYMKLSAGTGGSGSIRSRSGSKVHGLGGPGSVTDDSIVSTSDHASMASGATPTMADPLYPYNGEGQSGRGRAGSAHSGGPGGVARGPPGTQLMWVTSPPPLPIGRGILNPVNGTVVSAAVHGHGGALASGGVLHSNGVPYSGSVTPVLDGSRGAAVEMVTVSSASTNNRDAGSSDWGRGPTIAVIDGGGGGGNGSNGCSGSGGFGDLPASDGMLASLSEPASPSLGKLPSERTRQQVQELEDTMMELSPQERDRLLRDELLLLSPLIRQVFPTLPSTTCSFILQADDEVDTNAAKYLRRLLEKMREHQKTEVVPLRTTGDGSCLLNALSRGIWGVELFSEALRHQLCDELSTYREWYCSHLPPHDVEEAAQQAACPGAFLSNLHVVAMAHVLRRPVVLFDAEAAMSSYGAGLYGTAGVFAPLRLPQRSWWPWPVFISWSSDKHNHFVPLVWSARSRPATRWLWPEDFYELVCQESQELGLCPTVASSAVRDPFVLPPADRAALFKRAARVGIQEPLLVLQLVDEVRRQVVALEGALLARVLALAANDQGRAAQGPCRPTLASEATTTSTDGSLTLSFSRSISPPSSSADSAAVSTTAPTSGTTSMGGTNGPVGVGPVRRNGTEYQALPDNLAARGWDGGGQRDGTPGLGGSGVYSGGAEYGSGAHGRGTFDTRIGVLGGLRGQEDGNGRQGSTLQGAGGKNHHQNGRGSGSAEDDGAGDRAGLLSSWRSLSSMLRMSSSSLGDASIAEEGARRGSAVSLRGGNTNASGRTLASAASDLSINCDNVDFLDAVLATPGADYPDTDAFLPSQALTPMPSHRREPLHGTGSASATATSSSLRGQGLAISPPDLGPLGGPPPLLPSTTPRVRGGGGGAHRAIMSSQAPGNQSLTSASSSSQPTSLDASGNDTVSSGSVRAKAGERWDDDRSNGANSSNQRSSGGAYLTTSPFEGSLDNSGTMEGSAVVLNGSAVGAWPGMGDRYGGALDFPGTASHASNLSEGVYGSHAHDNHGHNQEPVPANHASEAPGSNPLGLLTSGVSGGAGVLVASSQHDVADSFGITEAAATMRGLDKDAALGHPIYGGQRSQSGRIAQPAGSPLNSGSREWARAAEQMRQQRHGIAVAGAALSRLGNELPAQYRQVAGSNGRRISRLAHAAVRIASEWHLLQRAPLAGIIAGPLVEDDLFDWRAVYEGPGGTPWEGGRFVLELRLPATYPRHPPTSVVFKTSMFHPNIGPDGRPCLNFIRQPTSAAGSQVPDGMSDGVREAVVWSPYHSLTSVLLCVQQLFFEVLPHQPLNHEAARMFVEDYVGWRRQVQRCVADSRR